VTEPVTSPGKLAIVLIWLGSSLVFVALILLFIRPVNALEALGPTLLIWCGPFWILLLTRGSGLLVKLLIALVVALPAVGGGVWLVRRWRGLSPRVRVLVLLAISTAWHLPAVVFFMMVLSSFN
jgi:hypothetical protein